MNSSALARPRHAHILLGRSHYNVEMPAIVT
jgi:hypothetical protein